jgi:hypothetical protein
MKNATHLFVRNTVGPLLIGVVILLSICATAEDKTTDARAFVDSALSMFDQGKYSEMYDLFDPSMRQLTRELWIEASKKVAQQRGKVVNRALSTKSRSMGAYRFIFNTQCSEGKVYEDVTAIDSGSGWKLGGFWVKPNLD